MSRRARSSPCSFPHFAVFPPSLLSFSDRGEVDPPSESGRAYKNLNFHLQKELLDHLTVARTETGVAAKSEAAHTHTHTQSSREQHTHARTDEEAEGKEREREREKQTSE